MELAKRYLLLLTNFNKIEFLFYVKELLSYLLLDMDGGVSVTDMWEKLKEDLNLHFYEFLSEILKKLFGVFTQPCMEIIDYALEILLQTYKKMALEREKC